MSSYLVPATPLQLPLLPLGVPVKVKGFDTPAPGFLTGLCSRVEFRLLEGPFELPHEA